MRGKFSALGWSLLLTVLFHQAVVSIPVTDTESESETASGVESSLTEVEQEESGADVQRPARAGPQYRYSSSYSKLFHHRPHYFNHHKPLFQEEEEGTVKASTTSLNGNSITTTEDGRILIKTHKHTQVDFRPSTGDTIIKVKDGPVIAVTQDGDVAISTRKGEFWLDPTGQFTAIRGDGVVVKPLAEASIQFEFPDGSPVTSVHVGKTGEVIQQLSDGSKRKLDVYGVLTALEDNYENTGGYTEGYTEAYTKAYTEAYTKPYTEAYAEPYTTTTERYTTEPKPYTDDSNYADSVAGRAGAGDVVGSLVNVANNDIGINVLNQNQGSIVTGDQNVVTSSGGSGGLGIGTQTTGTIGTGTGTGTVIIPGGGTTTTTTTTQTSITMIALVQLFVSTYRTALEMGQSQQVALAFASRVVLNRLKLIIRNHNGAVHVVHGNWPGQSVGCSTSRGSLIDICNVDVLRNALQNAGQRLAILSPGATITGGGSFAGDASLGEIQTILNQGGLTLRPVAGGGGGGGGGTAAGGVLGLLGQLLGVHIDSDRPLISLTDVDVGSNLGQNLLQDSAVLSSNAKIFTDSSAGSILSGGGVVSGGTMEADLQTLQAVMTAIAAEHLASGQTGIGGGLTTIGGGGGGLTTIGGGGGGLTTIVGGGGGGGVLGGLGGGGGGGGTLANLQRISILRNALQNALQRLCVLSDNCHIGPQPGAGGLLAGVLGRDGGRHRHDELKGRASGSEDGGQGQPQYYVTQPQGGYQQQQQPRQQPSHPSSYYTNNPPVTYQQQQPGYAAPQQAYPTVTSPLQYPNYQQPQKQY